MDRLRWAYQEQQKGRWLAVVSYSGGKDSEVLLQLARRAAADVGLDKIDVYHVDEEFVLRWTREALERIATYPDVRLTWLQTPYWTNCSWAGAESWILTWDPECEDRWVWPRHPLGVQCNRVQSWPDALRPSRVYGQTVLALVGIRGRESRARMLSGFRCWNNDAGMPVRAIKTDDPAAWPLFDWHQADIWKALIELDMPVSSYYDLVWRLTGHKNTRSSSVHHEFSAKEINMYWLLDPETMQRIERRVGAASAERQRRNYRALLFETMYPPSGYGSWREVFEALAEVIPERYAARFRKRIRDEWSAMCAVDALIDHDFRLWRFKGGILI